MTTLAHLAERVEAASGPDREIDALVQVAIDPSNNARVIYGKGRRFFMGADAGRVPFVVRFGTGTKFGLINQEKRYTASLDAALTLVEGELFGIVLDAYNNNRWTCELSTSLADGKSGECATKELAAVAASLRARARSA